MRRASRRIGSRDLVELRGGGAARRGPPTTWFAEIGYRHGQYGVALDEERVNPLHLRRVDRRSEIRWALAVPADTDSQGGQRP